MITYNLRPHAPLYGACITYNNFDYWLKPVHKSYSLVTLICNHNLFIKKWFQNYSLVTLICNHNLFIKTVPKSYSLVTLICNHNLFINNICNPCVTRPTNDHTTQEGADDVAVYWSWKCVQHNIYNVSPTGLGHHSTTSWTLWLSMGVIVDRIVVLWIVLVIYIFIYKPTSSLHMHKKIKNIHHLYTS